MTYILAYDIGSTSLKTCLFRIDETIEMIGNTSADYGLYTLPDGGAEQHMEEWWDAMCRSTKRLMEHAPIEPGQIDGISFCSQMQGLVLVFQDRRYERLPSADIPQDHRSCFRKCERSSLEVPVGKEPRTAGFR